MKEILRELISKSQVLTGVNKAIYSKMVEYLSDEKLKQLVGILSKEHKEVAKIAEAKESKKAKVTDQYLSLIENIFENEQKRAFRHEEEKDRERGDALLEDLKNI